MKIDECFARLAEARWRVLAVLGAFAFLAYLPALFLPLIADDYVQIEFARQYGPVSGWTSLLADPLYRCRATSLLLTHWTESLFGISALTLNLTGVLLHIVNTWLVYALGSWRLVGWRLSFLAAIFFAVAEGHQEAVIWYAALPELLVFTFVLLSVLCWIRAVQTSSNTSYLWSIFFFILAVFSKESAIVAVPLNALVLAVERRTERKFWYLLAPFAIGSLLYFASIYGHKTGHLHFNDGTFSLSAPFWITIWNSTGRLLWFWGFLGLAAVIASRSRQAIRMTSLCFAWIVIAFLPYAFLTYMPRVPSRHTYLASVGLALLIAVAISHVPAYGRFGRQWAAVAMALVILHNCGYLWTRKQEQYQRRAEPTEALIRFIERSGPPVRLRCFPYGPDVARLAVKIRTRYSPDSVVWTEPLRPCAVDYSFSFGETTKLESQAQIPGS